MIYLYYPFDDGTGMNILDSLVRGVGNKTQPTHTFQSPAVGELYCDDGTTPGGLWGVNNGDEIYIIGHSHSGFKVLGDNDKNTIDQTEIVDRLTRCGLPTGINCKINVYACYSAKTLDQKPGLAAHLSSALRTAEFSCFDNVWGYTKKVLTKAKKNFSGDYVLHLDMNGSWQPISNHDYAFIKVDPHV